MEGKEAIIKRILDDAEAKAATIRLSAEENRANTLQEAEEWSALYLEKQRALLQAESEDRIARKSTVAELDVRKELLAAKREVLDNVYTLALKKLENLSKQQYLSVLSNMLQKYAEVGEQIILSKSSETYRKDIETLPVVQEKKLRLSESCGDFSGGILLLGEKCDKDLSFDTALKTLKTQIESETAEHLFE